MQHDLFFKQPFWIGTTTKTSGAGEGNRTLVFSLEGCGSTIELHPHQIFST